MPDIDGGLIGGASLVAEEFVAICRRELQELIVNVFGVKCGNNSLGCTRFDGNGVGWSWC